MCQHNPFQLQATLTWQMLQLLVQHLFTCFSCDVAEAQLRLRFAG